MGRQVPLRAFRHPFCRQCGHPVREHQPSHGPGGKKLTAYVGCIKCDCILTMEAKMKAWRGDRK